MESNTITFIGPLGVGKSTQARLMAEKTGQKVASHDEMKLSLLQDAGFDLNEGHRIRDEDGMYAMWSYGNSYSIITIAQFVSDHDGDIVDLGAADHCFDKVHQTNLVRDFFESYPNIILLLPSPNLAISINALPGIKDKRQMNTYFIMHPSNQIVAKHCIYTFGKSKEVIHEEIVSIIRWPNK